MSQYEKKACPRCQQPFECKAGSVTQCDCSRILLSEEERAFIAGRYDDCLCFSCLNELKNKDVFFQEKQAGA